VTGWVEEYVRDRSQAVHVNSNESAIMVLKFGVPQGSVLCPKIFTNYAEDVSEIFNQHDLSHHLFADDMQCLCYGKPAEVPYMVKRIENCVIDVWTWCAAKRLQLNADKTEILWFGSAVNLRKLSRSERRQTSHYSSESWCSDRRRVINARPHLATGADHRRASFTYAVYAQCECVVSSAKTSRNDWSALSYCHASITVT